MRNELQQIFSGFIDLILPRKETALRSWKEIGVLLVLVVLLLVVVLINTVSPPWREYAAKP